MKVVPPELLMDILLIVVPRRTSPLDRAPELLYMVLVILDEKGHHHQDFGINIKLI
jgi:hypothetical protein